MFQSQRVITELDAARIRELGAGMPDRGRQLAPLGELIDLVREEADIVPRSRIGADIVTVNSTVSFRDETTGTVHRVTLVYPRDFSVSARRISLLSPVGRALLGRKVGALASFATPDGATRTIRVLELHYQPEACGHPDL
jgi:regulator of nucleoside diphosphate kinase